MSGLVTIELTRSVELARSVERARSFYGESDCSNRTVLQRVSAMVNPWAARHDCV
jgi:hypothetical protein